MVALRVSKIEALTGSFNEGFSEFVAKQKVQVLSVRTQHKGMQINSSVVIHGLRIQTGNIDRKELVSRSSKH